MEESAHLEDVIRQAETNLSGNPKGELILPYRKRIWAALGPREFSGKLATRGVGHRRRTALAILSARQVLAIWENVYPTDKDPSRLIVLSERYLGGQTDSRSVEKDRDALWTHADGLVHQGGDMAAIHAGYAAAKAASTALWDENFEEDDMDSELDQDLDPYEWDAAFQAAGAQADGFPWVDGASSERRRGFWNWYLHKAARSVYDEIS